jgi:hypothetical protein
MRPEAEALLVFAVGAILSISNRELASSNNWYRFGQLVEVVAILLLVKRNGDEQ